MKYELKSLKSVEREELMKEANFHVSIPPKQGLAMKADLCIPWKCNLNKLSDGSSLASEKCQQALTKTQLCQIETSSESVPFSLNTKNGGQELRQV